MFQHAVGKLVGDNDCYLAIIGDMIEQSRENDYSGAIRISVKLFAGLQLNRKLAPLRGVSVSAKVLAERRTSRVMGLPSEVVMTFTKSATVSPLQVQPLGIAPLAAPAITSPG
jgi:hypothetical protein